MLQACLNGARTKAEAAALPITAGELGADAVAVRAAGAEELHLHPRNAEGAESLSPEDVANALEAVRAASPGAPVGVGTGEDIAPGGRARLDHIRAWRDLPAPARPDYASVNLVEADAPETMAALASVGVRIEAGLWSAEDARRLVSLGDAPAPLRLLVETIVDDPLEAAEIAQEVVAIVRENGLGAPILLHGFGGSAWPMAAMAKREGYDMRIGFEDTLLLPDGAPAASNRELVAAAAALIAD